LEKEEISAVAGSGVFTLLPAVKKPVFAVTGK
jgi:hypothetical protein